ncbi:unnamed protein product [Trifolium pratense]|uniref:Uncharacterized protein n=1 Tax=Trifolium pratense TaxID=57577 RepID=A0ACB0IZU2_TRIPR|nr:unnamed protein product [Trifolium pratense]
MGDRIDTLESQFGAMQLTLASVVEQLKELSKKMDLQGLSSNPPPIVHSTAIPVHDETVDNSSMSESRLAGKKVKLPVFDGDDPVAWITRAEIYFDVQQTPDEMRVKLSRLSMEGPTIHWFNLLLETEDDLSREKLKKALIARYGGRRLENPFEELSTLRQQSSVEEYVEAFELLSSQMQMMRMAKDVEDELRGDDDDVERGVGKKYVGRSEGSGLGLNYRNGSSSTQKENTKTVGPGWNNPTRKMGSNNSNSNSNSSLSSTGRKGENDRRIPANDRWKGVRNEEMEERRVKGLCFKCGGKWHPTLHKCPERALRVVILADGETIGKDGEIIALEAESSDDEEEVVEAECKLIGVLGKMGEYNTMKLEGKLKDDEDDEMWKFTPTVVKRIKLGDGHRVLSEGICKDIRLKLGSKTFVVDALVLGLGGLDIVLGVSWLSTLGKVVMDWKDLTMQFNHKGEVVTLRGGKQLQNEYLNSFLGGKEGRGSCEGWWAEMQHSQVSEGVTQQNIVEVLEGFPEVFKDTIALPPVRTQVHKITLMPNHGPVNVRPYKYPHHQKAEIEKQVSEMLKSGVIRPSTSAFSSPVILVKKKDHTWRMCIDYRALNKVTIPDKYPIPIVDELLDELHGSTIFSKIDLKSGYHQIRVLDSDIDKTAFRTHNGHYEFLVMPFGLMNAPATFQSTMNDIFRPFLRQFVLVFFDDILVYSKTETEHVQHLKMFLTVLATNSFVANKSKCKFGCEHIDYLGHIIYGAGVSVDPGKIQCIIDWPEPRNVKGVRGFLGLTGYYRKFVKDYGKIARPLTDLTKKDNFKWSMLAKEAFEKLKVIMTTPPVLKLPNFAEPFEIECDAAGRGIGVVLMQGKQPIAYFSKALSDGNLAKSVYEKELMALVLAIQHWRHYLLGKAFVVYTDHRSLKHFLQQRISSPDQQCWLAKLLGYQFEVVYKPGVENKAADALSRCYDEGELTALVSSPIWTEKDKILADVKADVTIQKLMSEVETDPTAKPGFSIQHGVLLYHDRLVIGANSDIIPKLLKEFHETPMGGHSGFVRTYRRMAENLYWVGMQKTIRDYVRACDVCQRQKYEGTSPGGLLQPLPIPNGVWEDISMDFITGLPKSKGYEAVLVVVDRLSKYSHFILMKHPYTAKSVAGLFVKEVVRLHGIPNSIVSDRDPLFISIFWKELFKMQGTTLKMSSSYHPETDGQSEVTNRCLESYLRCFAAEQPKNWSTWVPWAEYWFNTTYHVSIGKSPFEVVYGRQPPKLLRFLSNETKVDAVALELQERDEALKQLKLHLLKAQQQMQAYANQKRRDLKFEVGDWVFLKLRPHRQHSVIRRINQKLAPRFYGPFMIIEKIGEVAYKLQLPDHSRIHPVFHVSLLKRAVGDYHAQGDLPKELDMAADNEIHPLRVLGHRSITRDGSSVSQSLIQWKEKSIDDITWEDNDVMAGQFPDFDLEDKVHSKGGGIDGICDPNNQVGLEFGVKPKIWRVYARQRGKRAEAEKRNEV